MNKFYSNTYAVESVSRGHPDKICDQISDAILDECLKQDPNTRAGVEVLGSHGLIVIGGEVTTTAKFDPEAIARNIYSSIGYTEPVKVISQIAKQSPDIAQGVDIGGAGDQGVMYGYASDENKNFLPNALIWVHRLAQQLEILRKSNSDFRWLGPDGKTQITVENGKISSVLVSCQHQEGISQEEILALVKTQVIEPILGDVSGMHILVNPTGQFIQGGFAADAGLTGRKIMVDTYGGLIPHGGGCFSGKDATKVDRSAAYMARFAAKNIVANGLAKQCLISVAYAIGRAEPLMISAIDEAGQDLSELVKQKFDFRPAAIIERLDLKQPIYLATSAYGHFGRAGFPWEEVTSI